MSSKYYGTYEEASKAAQAIKPKIEKYKEYQALYKKDPKLPSSPDNFYKNKGWEGFPAFFGLSVRKPYGTYQEALNAVITLDIKTVAEYRVRYKEDDKLHANPNKFYENKGWISFNAFLGKRQRENYDTYQEASDAAIALGLKTAAEYYERYKDDHGLPSDPVAVYKDRGWQNWKVFLGGIHKEPYETYEQASKAACSLGIKTLREYGERYKEDPKLPSNPNKTYEDKWVSYPEFLGLYAKYYSYAKMVSEMAEHPNEIRKLEHYTKFAAEDIMRPHYPSKDLWDEYYDWASFVGTEYADCIDALDLLAEKGRHVKDEESYLTLRELYRSLPEDPISTYGFNSFTDFLSFKGEMLWDVKQVKEYCQKHRIKNKAELDSHAQTNPFIALNYKNIIGYHNVSQMVYRPEFSTLDKEELSEWRNIASEWRGQLEKIGKRISVLNSFFAFHVEFFTPHPADYCKTSNYDKQRLNVWLNSQPDSTKQIASVNTLVTFFDFILEKTCAHTCEETGEVMPMEGYANPIRPHDIEVSLAGNVKLSESNKQPIPFKYIDRAREYLVPEKHGNSVTSISTLFEHLDNKTSLYRNFSEWFEVDEYIIDKSDVDCVWKEDKGKFLMWSPVRVIALYTQLFMPFRGGQLCWLDSGEADEYILTNKDDKLSWEENTLLKPFRVPQKNWQGFLKPSESIVQIDKNNITDVSCHVNTNKTAKNSYTGYDIPWIDERILPWIIRLRVWQTKYNPLMTPSKWSNEFKSAVSTDRDLAKYGYKGQTCFLFRDPTASKTNPLTQTKLAAAFSGLLYLIQDKELPLAYVKKGKTSAALSNFGSYFTLHSMRVSLITAFIRDAKIAPEIIQKLVGHSSIVMTIYYTKVTSIEIQEALRHADSLILKNQSKRLEQLIRNREMAKAKSELIGHDGEIVTQNWDMPSAAFSFMDYGICPNGRTRCHDGGEPIPKDISLRSRVQSGYLGASNCLQCVHFVTGPAFLGGLQLVTNEISLECKAASIKIDELKEKRVVLEDEEYQATLNEESFLKAHQLSLADSHYEQEVTRFDSLICDLISALRFSMNSVQLLNQNIRTKNETGSPNLIARTDEDAIEFKLQDVSDFLHLDMVCQAASFYQSSRPENASIQRSSFLDLFAKKNGLSPGMFMLTDQQKLEIGNEMTKLLLARTGSWEKVDQLMSKENTITLSELGFTDDQTTQELTCLLEGKSLGERDNLLTYEHHGQKKVAVNE